MDFDAVKLPSEWKRIRLEDVCEFKYGSALPESERKQGSVRVYGSNGVVGSHNVALTKGTTIVVGRKGSVGAVNLSPEPCYPIDTTYWIDEVASNVDMDWLRHALEALDLSRFNKASGVPGLNREDVYRLAIPLPPLPDQQRIARILKFRLAAVERACRASEVRLQAARALPAAYLRQVFESEEARGWPTRRIGDFARVQSGYAFKSDWFVEDGIRLLRNVNVAQERVDWSDTVHLARDRYEQFSAFALAAGDIVLSLDRPIVAAGLKVARLSDQDVPALLLQRVGRFVFGSEDLLPDFLYSFLRSTRFAQQITGHDYSLGVPHISPSQVENAELPVPRLSRQREVAERLAKQLAHSRSKLSPELDNQGEALAHLPPALLRQAFSGAL